MSSELAGDDGMESALVMTEQEWDLLAEVCAFYLDRHPAPSAPSVGICNRVLGDAK